jgi:hypothetical protein
MNNQDAPSSSTRTKMLEELAQFMDSAISIKGILRISLIGSLCTNKAIPKDVDVLINIDDSADLAPLAKLARKLNGSVQSINHNADVFLADPQMNYLGRICLWKQCGPGIRASCDALHCGTRKYLHNDLNTITLDSELIKKPPIEIWPEIHARVLVPLDLKIILLEHLMSQGMKCNI